MKGQDVWTIRNETTEQTRKTSLQLCTAAAAGSKVLSIIDTRDSKAGSNSSKQKNK